jgi:hypothetical protein
MLFISIFYVKILFLFLSYSLFSDLRSLDDFKDKMMIAVKAPEDSSSSIEVFLFSLSLFNNLNHEFNSVNLLNFKNFS